MHDATPERPPTADAKNAAAASAVVAALSRSHQVPPPLPQARVPRRPSRQRSLSGGAELMTTSISKWQIAAAALTPIEVGPSTPMQHVKAFLALARKPQVEISGGATPLVPEQVPPAGDGSETQTDGGQQGGLARQRSQVISISRGAAKGRRPGIWQRIVQQQPDWQLASAASYLRARRGRASRAEPGITSINTCNCLLSESDGRYNCMCRDGGSCFIRCTGVCVHYHQRIRQRRLLWVLRRLPMMHLCLRRQCLGRRNPRDSAPTRSLTGAARPDTNMDHVIEVWFHGEISRKEAERLIASHGASDGLFPCAREQPRATRPWRLQCAIA